MTTRRGFLGGCVLLGLVAAVGAGAMTPRNEGKDVAARKRAMRETIEKLTTPLLERLDRKAKFLDVKIDHEIAVARLDSDIEQAAKIIEMREINLKEYELGYYPSAVQTLEGNIQLAEADLAKAKDRLEHSDKMLKAGAVNELQNQGDRLAVEKAEFTLLEVQKKLNVLKSFTKIKRLTELQADIDRARSFERDLKKRAEFLKAEHEAAARKINADATLSDSEFRILVLLREAIALQADGKLDQAEQRLAEASRLTLDEQDRLAQERLLDTQERLIDAIGALRRAAPKAQ